MKSYLQRRQNIKSLMERASDTNISNLQIQSSLIKLLVNSVYGYTILDEASNKYKMYSIITTKHFRKKTNKSRYAPLGYITEDKFCTVQHINKSSLKVKRILPEIGSLILQSSKIILLKAIYFIFSHACPTKCMFLYSDTDSIHIALSEHSIR